MGAEDPGQRPRIAATWRLLGLLLVAAVSGWVAAATFTSAELESRALEAVRERARGLEEPVRAALRAGADPTDARTQALLAAGDAWLVDRSGQPLAGTGTLPALPDGARPEQAFAAAQVLSAVGDDGAVSVVPLTEGPEASAVLVVGETGAGVRAAVRRTWLLLGLVAAVATVVVGAVGGTFVRQMRLRLEQRSQALRVLLQRERETVERLGEVDAMKSAFLTATSHELRTPLTVVAGFTELLAARGDQLSPEQIQQLASGLEDKTTRLTQLIDDLLDVDRLARGVLEPVREPVEVSALLERTLRGMRAPEHELCVHGVDGTFHVDPGHLQRVVEHLVRNATKFAPPGSPIDVLAQVHDDALEIVVADRGPGIPDARKATLFEPLQRVDEDDPNPGLGVGLALVGRLTELHGGSAWVTDRPGGGLEAHARFAQAVVPGTTA